MSTELEHAVKWVKWIDGGEIKEECPWKNHYQFKKQRPKPEIEAQARELLGKE